MVIKWPEFLSYEQVRQYCGLSRTSIWRAIRLDDIEAVKVGRLVKVRRSSLDAYLDRNAYSE